jgi:tripartite-type tricarboxylate transporter receptor subunit TctC
MTRRWSRRHILIGGGLAGVGLLGSGAGSAQDYPAGPIRIVLGSAAGTPPDLVIRIVANELTQASGWRFVVENKPGAIQTLGAMEALKQPADGYTVLTVAMAATAARALLPNVGFSLATDFAPVINLATAYHVLVVNPAVPAHSLADLVALLKKEPDSLNFSSGGFGTPAHLAGEMFKLQADTRARHVPYQALPRAIGDLLNGTNHFQFITPLPVLDLIATGKLRALAVTSPQRVTALPAVPTVEEAGYPGLIIQDWVGLLVKAGTPDPVVARLNRAANAALASLNVREALLKLSAEPAGGTPEEFGALIREQVAHWTTVIRRAGIKMHQ